MNRASFHTYAPARRAIAAGAVLAAVASGAVIARADDTPRAAAAKGGLKLSPVMIEKPAAAGPVGTITVANESATALDVTVKARPWTQAATGQAAADRRRTLAGVQVSAGAFTLAPGAKQAVDVTLGAVPGAGSLYGAVEVVGLPADAAKRKGVVLGYRLISSLRLNPAAPVLRLRPGTPKPVRSGTARALVLPVRNAGNTLQPVSGDVSLKNALGTRSRTIPATRILPGKTVNLPLSSARGIPAGTYAATVKLKQGKTVTTVKKTVRVTR